MPASQQLVRVLGRRGALYAWLSESAAILCRRRQRHQTSGTRMLPETEAAVKCHRCVEKGRASTSLRIRNRRLLCGRAAYGVLLQLLLEAIKRFVPARGGWRCPARTSMSGLELLHGARVAEGGKNFAAKELVAEMQPNGVLQARPWRRRVRNWAMRGRRSVVAMPGMQVEELHHARQGTRAAARVVSTLSTPKGAAWFDFERSS